MGYLSLDEEWFVSMCSFPSGLWELHVQSSLYQCVFLFCFVSLVLFCFLNLLVICFRATVCSLRLKKEPQERVVTLVGKSRDMVATVRECGGRRVSVMSSVVRLCHQEIEAST